MSFNDETVQKVWEKGTIDPYNDPKVYRKDYCKAWINRQQYGNRNSIYGWEIDHITPKDKDGSDELSNLRPLQWENNASRQAGRLDCVVTSEGTKNVRVKQ